MLKRIGINYRGKRILAHPLTTQLLGGEYITSDEELHSQNVLPTKTDERDVIAKQKILKDWNNLTSDEILERLSKLNQSQIIKETEDNANWQSEILLLRALAKEKSLLQKRTELIEAYFECQGGHFYKSIILNNQAILKIKENNCNEVLKLFHQAILQCFEKQNFHQAPFYNFVLIIVHLDKIGFMDESSQKLLDEIFEKVKPSHKKTENSYQSIQNSPLTLSKCRTIIHFINSNTSPENQTSETDGVEFYNNKSAYLVPQFDIWNSFGDQSQAANYRSFNEKMKRANELVKKGQYSDSINLLEYASQSVSFFISSSESSTILKKLSDERISEIKELWRISIDEKIRKCCLKGKFEDAINILSSLDEKVVSTDEKDLINSLIKKIQEMRYSAELDQIENLIAQKELHEAKSACEILLLDSEINDAVRKRVTKHLIELQGGSLDD